MVFFTKKSAYCTNSALTHSITNKLYENRTQLYDNMKNNETKQLWLVEDYVCTVEGTAARM